MAETGFYTTENSLHYVMVLYWGGGPTNIEHSSVWYMIISREYLLLGGSIPQMYLLESSSAGAIDISEDLHRLFAQASGLPVMKVLQSLEIPCVNPLKPEYHGPQHPY